MLYLITIVLILISLAVGVMNHRLWLVIGAILPALIFALKIVAGLALMMGIWLGLMRIVDGLGWVRRLTSWMRPVMRRLFPELDPDDKAFDYIGLNMTANMLGMGNAATPFGLRAMHELQKSNPVKSTANDAMCLFLAINTSSVQLLPITAMTMLAVGGAAHPWVIVLPTLLATSVSTFVGITASWCFKSWRFFKVSV